MTQKNWQRFNFICKECGQETWMECDLNTYVIKAEDLVCDDCFVEDED